MAYNESKLWKRRKSLKKIPHSSKARILGSLSLHHPLFNAVYLVSADVSRDNKMQKLLILLVFYTIIQTISYPATSFMFVSGRY